MRRSERKQLEEALARGYRRERATAAHFAGHAERTAALVAAAAEHPQRTASIFELARAVAVFSPRILWAAPAAVVVLALVFALSDVPAREAEAALVASGLILAAASLAGVVRARSCRMQELEASCLCNAVAVAVARLGLFGGASLLALALACGSCSAVVPVGAAAAYALAPYLLSAAGGLMLARRVASDDAAVAAVAWSAGVCALCIVLRVAIPDAYCDAAVWVWAAAAAAGALWCAREVVRWLRFSIEGACLSEKAAQAGVF